MRKILFGILVIVLAVACGDASDQSFEVLATSKNGTV